MRHLPDPVAFGWPPDRGSKRGLAPSLRGACPLFEPTNHDLTYRRICATAARASSRAITRTPGTGIRSQESRVTKLPATDSWPLIPDSCPGWARNFESKHSPTPRYGWISRARRDQSAEGRSSRQENFLLPSAHCDCLLVLPQSRAWQRDLGRPRRCVWCSPRFASFETTPDCCNHEPWNVPT